jgi:hypothetical protein
MMVLISAAHAFCGTYVGGANSDIYNRASTVAIVRQNGHTTLSMANDVEGDFTDFALVVPVPEVPGEDDIHVLAPELFDDLDRYSQPRLVRYECEDFEPQEADADTDSDSDSDTDVDTGGVEVEAEYTVGEYDVVILSAQQSGALVDWLNDNGYSVPESSADLLGEYLDSGSYFFAAKVDADAGIKPGDMLSPLQVKYQSQVFGLPIRLGTLNSRGVQDLIIYALNPYNDGVVGISNYPEVAVEDECLFTGEDETFEEFAARQFNEAYQSVDGGMWALEYSWAANGCDPCTGTPPTDVDLVSLGYDPSARTQWGVQFTRLHMRYTPEEADQDLSLYLSNQPSNDQLRYIEYAPELEDKWPLCDVGWASDPGTCDDGASDTASGGNGKRGCSSVPAAPGALALLLAAACRRRRS